MTLFVPWNSQPLQDWASKHAPGKFIDLDGCSTHYLERGSGDPIILIHGFFFDSCMWNRNIDVLAQSYKVYAIDLWGFGFSTREALDYGYSLYAEQLRRFMDALDIRKASLIGQSMGGGTIIKFAISNRDRVDRIVLVDAAGLPNPLPIMGKISNLPGIGEFMYGFNSDFIRKITFGTTFLCKKENLTEEFFENVTRFHKIAGTSDVMLDITRKQFFDTLSGEIEELGAMRMPTLIVWGRADKAIPLSIGEKMHRILKGSQLKILDQAGHCPNIDQPDEFNRIVMRCLAET